MRAELCYQGFVGYYNARKKVLRWEKPELMYQANLFAKQFMLLKEAPLLKEKIVKNYGLEQVPGITFKKAAPPKKKKFGKNDW